MPRGSRLDEGPPGAREEEAACRNARAPARVRPLAAEAPALSSRRRQPRSVPRPLLLSLSLLPRPQTTFRPLPPLPVTAPPPAPCAAFVLFVYTLGPLVTSRPFSVSFPSSSVFQLSVLSAPAIVWTAPLCGRKKAHPNHPKRGGEGDGSPLPACASRKMQPQRQTTPC